ncbi:hypothetical protein B0H63DRAFT_302852 [Podospora didyma]|uniref:Secreted protein n=1 Tax=Podospora didyma TaxID=330526 RepID=A0AAE0KB81_9PEZI|nr:hypothetical protein B0H63DRAFT_302852 [Podospora didyma]
MPRRSHDFSSWHLCIFCTMCALFAPFCTPFCTGNTSKPHLGPPPLANRLGTSTPLDRTCVAPDSRRHSRPITIRVLHHSVFCVENAVLQRQPCEGTPSRRPKWRRLLTNTRIGLMEGREGGTETDDCMWASRRTSKYRHELPGSFIPKESITPTFLRSNPLHECSPFTILSPIVSFRGDVQTWRLDWTRSHPHVMIGGRTSSRFIHPQVSAHKVTACTASLSWQTPNLDGNFNRRR